MKVVASRTLTHADRQRQYRERQGVNGRQKNAARMRVVRAAQIPTFIGVDSEGIGQGKNHRTVLLGVGENQYIAANTRLGLQWKEVFEFLYSQYKANPNAAFVGFYLSYDFNNWLSSLPQQIAWLLLTKKGLATRKMSEVKARRRQYHPVRYDGWEFDMMSDKRLSIRPRVCDCAERKLKCEHDQNGWMHVCDAGSFFQSSFLTAIDPKNWNEPVCTPQEFNTVLIGKNERATARLNARMKYYNRLENVILARLMARLARGFADIGIRLGKDEWYGPGATAAKWLRQHDAVKATDLAEIMPAWFTAACKASYYGGWFEIFSHGIILGTSYNYDINNAYPFAATKLPHLCAECQYRQGRNAYNGISMHVLMYCTVYAKSKRIGPVPYRAKDGSILRPDTVKGWYWKFEIDAAQRAGLIRRIVVHEWAEFTPCSHKPPFTEIETLYYKRLEVGKNTALGKGIKLNNNSIYGKFAQSVGSAPFNNWFYASYITAHCRTQILDAIATHPGGLQSVLMVATDGVCFDSPHPGLPISTKLGQWEQSEYQELCLFKPGVYWHKEGKDALLKVKSRGVPKEEFKAAISDIELQFRAMIKHRTSPGDILVQHEIEEAYGWERIFGDRPIYTFQASSGWPHFLVPIKFRLKSCRQALNEGKWNNAALVQNEVRILQSSEPYNKRTSPRYNHQKRRVDTIIHSLPAEEIETTYYGDAVYPPSPDYGIGFEGNARGELLEAVQILRDKPANYDIDLGQEYEWTTVWDGGPV